MNLNARTIQILKNFSHINPSIVFKPGQEIATVSPGKTVLVKAKVEEDFDTAFAIYDLSKFLSVLSLFDEPELSFNDKTVTVSSGKHRVNYVFADLSLFQGKDKVDPYTKSIILPTEDVVFKVTSENLADIKKALAVLRLPEIAVVGDGETIALEAIDSANPSGDVYAVDVGETDKTFRFIFKKENLELVPDDYEVTICAKGISRFKSMDVEYMVAVEANSSYEG